jgi:hypothetical protein
MPVDKPRVVGTLRPVGRDMHDYRAAASVPSATGGAPKNIGAALAGATGNEIAPPLVTDPGIVPQLVTDPAIPNVSDVQTIQQMVEQGRLRYQQSGVLSRLPLLNRSIQDYTVNNQEIVGQTKNFLDNLQAQGRDITAGVFEDTDQMARWAVAHIMRSFEPGPMPSVPDFIHQSRQGRNIMMLTHFIREAHNAGA